MDEDVGKPSTSQTFSFECDSCGQYFESWDRLREHHVDCQIDTFESDL